MTNPLREKDWSNKWNHKIKIANCLFVRTSAIICKVIKTNFYRYLSNFNHFNFIALNPLYFLVLLQNVIVQCDVQWWAVYTESINKRQEGIKRIRENKQESL